MAKNKNAEIEQQNIDQIVAEETPQKKSALTESQLKDKQKYAYIIKRKRVRQKARRKTISLIMIIFVLVALLLTGLVYGVLSFINFNSFRISVERSNLDYLALSEDYEFSHPSSVLSVSGPKSMDNWTYSWLPITDMLNNQGSLSGDNFIATAFYLTNRGDQDVYYTENITLTNVYKGLEKAIRVLLIKQIVSTDEAGNIVMSDPEYRCFAMISADGVTPEYVAGGDDIISVPQTDPNNPNSSAPWYTIPFYEANSGKVLDSTYYPLMVNQKIRYAMAVWIEGTDPECSNDVLGGKISYAFQFSLLTDENNQVVTVDDK